MSAPKRKSVVKINTVPKNYEPLLAEIKTRVRSAQIKAGLSANRELLALYWDIGSLILSRQQKEGWGARVIDRLSVDLQRAFPGQQGFSPRNLKYMRAFAEAWPEPPIVQQAVAQLKDAPKNSKLPIVQAPLAQLSWYHHLALLDKLASPEDRLWYAAKTVEHGWSRNVLAHQIEAGLHKWQGRAVTNFKRTLPPAESDLAQGSQKILTFLTFSPCARTSMSGRSRKA
jgi:predicted nuclease of restriction endonuclease-like (RecB) superfamily